MNNVEPRYADLAEKALSGDLLSRAEMKSVIHGADERLPELLEAAFRVRHHYFGKKVQIHVLMNAKSGLCPEDCGYCSQSSVSDAEIDKYPFLAKEELVHAAVKAKEAGAMRFCLVNSGRGPTVKETEKMAEAVAEIKSKVPINICACMGCSRSPRLGSSRTPASSASTTTSTPAAATTLRWFRPTPTTTGWRPWRA